MSQIVFVDGVGEVRIQDGLVRMELVAVSPTRKDAEGRPQTDFVQQLVMSPQAFLRMVSATSRTLKALEEQGIVQRRAEDVAADLPAPSTTQ